MWLPIIDGVERVGVLEVRPHDRGAVDDPALHRQVWWLTHYLGHLLEAMDRYGDALDTVRRRRPRSVSAELVWNLLPPLDAATDKVLVSGRVEPSHDVGGDVFDYALGEHAAQPPCWTPPATTSPRAWRRPRPCPPRATAAGRGTGWSSRRRW